jgi:hypothetical protein
MSEISNVRIHHANNRHPLNRRSYQWSYSVMKDNSTPLDRIANQAISKIPVEPAPMHENPALAQAMQQLWDAAKEYDTRRILAETKHGRGYWKGQADAYRHVISVLAQLKV